MNTSYQHTRPWRLGVAIGAVALGLVYLPAAFAGNKVRQCKSNQTKMCDKHGKGMCVRNNEVYKKEAKGYLFPPGGGDSPCPSEPASPT